MVHKVWVLLLCIIWGTAGCDCGGKRRLPKDEHASESGGRGNKAYKKMIVNKWCTPEIDIKGFDLTKLPAEEQLTMKAYLGAMESMFESMCIQFYDDRDDAESRDSYETSVQMLDGTDGEGQKSFGDYEILADGKRLILHERGGVPFDIGLEMTRSYLKLRFQFSDLAKLGGSDEDLEDMPLEVANMAIYMKFSRQAGGEREQERVRRRVSD